MRPFPGASAVTSQRPSRMRSGIRLMTVDRSLDNDGLSCLSWNETSMKAILYAGVLLFLVVLVCGCTTTPSSQQTPAAANTTPSLLGNWSGTATGYIEGTGFTNYTGGSMIMMVTNQKDRIFEGQFVYPNLTGKTVDFAGAIGRDGRTLTLVEQTGGYSSGTLVSPAEIELIFADDARPFEVAIDQLKKT